MMGWLSLFIFSSFTPIVPVSSILTCSMFLVAIILSEPSVRITGTVLLFSMIDSRKSRFWVESALLISLVASAHISTFFLSSVFRLRTRNWV